MVDKRVDGRITSKCRKHAGSYDRSTASSKASSPVLLSTFSTLPSSKGTAVAQWLRCCATNRKVAGSILAGVS